MEKFYSSNRSDSAIRPFHTYSSNQRALKEKLRAENTNFLHAFSPIYYVSRVFGLMPFSIVCRTVRKPHVNIFDGIWFLLSILLYISLAINSYRNMKFPDEKNTASFIINVGDSLLLNVGLIYAALIIIFDMHNRFKLIEILNKFIAFDKEVNFNKGFSPNSY